MAGFEWFLVVYLVGSDEVLVKEMPSKQECIKMQKEFEGKAMKKIKTIEAITCEEGSVLETTSKEKKEDEIL